MEEDGEATGPAMAAEVEMAKEMKQNNYGRALEIFSAATTKNVRSGQKCLYVKQKNNNNSRGEFLWKQNC